MALGWYGDQTLQRQIFLVVLYFANGTQRPVRPHASFIYTQCLNSIQKYLHVPECQRHILWRQIEVVRCEDTWNRVHCIVTTPFEVSTTVSAIVLEWHMTLSVRWSALKFVYLYLHIQMYNVYVNVYICGWIWDVFVFLYPKVSTIVSTNGSLSSVSMNYSIHP